MKKLASILMAFSMMLSLMVIPNTIAYAADASIKVNASTVNIGDTITVTVTVSDGVTASLDVSYQKDLVNFTNCSITGSDNGNAVSMTMGVYAPQSPKTATITFLAKAAGTATFTVTPIKAGDEITPKNVRIIRPGYGLAPKFYDEILGQVALKDIKRGNPIELRLIGVKSE